MPIYNSRQTVSGTINALVGFSKNEDDPHVSGDAGAFVLAVRNDAGTAMAANGDYTPFQTDSTGALRVSGTSTIAGNRTFTDAYANPTDNLDTISLTGGFNGTTWDRIRSAGNNADAVAPTTLGNLTNDVYLFGYNGTNWDRIRAFGDNADGETVATLGDLQTKSRTYGFNGTTWDRQRSTGDNADAVATATLGEAIVIGRETLFNGTTWDRFRTAPGVTGSASVGGPTASDGVLAVAPVTIGARASSAVPTAVSADGDVVNLWANRNGRLRVADDRPNISGIYYGSVPFVAEAAAADAATGGRFWLQNPVGSALIGSVRSIEIQFFAASTFILSTTTPVWTLERFTFTGTASGAQVTAAKRDSTDPANTLTIRTASTGMTITAGAVVTSTPMPAGIVASSPWILHNIIYTFPEDSRPVLRAGEGLVMRQSTAGTAAGVRRAQFDLRWEEFTALGNV